ncbi:hypothetical protein P12x_004893 [Tundrisphaera lichenicola]|uniref:hypothetical protein n=1 Tax=Tundrisphaera lichenicola TaxID=2029860 RepID=UPI003EBF9717
MDHHVELVRLPDGLTFPPELSDRIGHDADRKRLWFRGFMCKAEFDRLNRLSDDWGYKRALEDLFRVCTLETPGHSPNRLAAIFGRLVKGREG